MNCHKNTVESYKLCILTDMFGCVYMIHTCLAKQTCKPDEKLLSISAEHNMDKKLLPILESESIFCTDLSSTAIWHINLKMTTFAWHPLEFEKTTICM